MELPQLTEHDKRNILGLNSARHYGLYGRQVQPVGQPGSAYQQGNLANYAASMQPGSPIDTVLQGVGYPVPITPVNLIPNDNFTKIKQQLTETGAGRSNTRRGWMAT